VSGAAEGAVRELIEREHFFSRWRERRWSSDMSLVKTETCNDQGSVQVFARFEQGKI
jgi:hypothetical protein